MNLTIKEMFKNASSVTRILAGVAKLADYKKLNEYIITMSQVDSISDVMREASNCLKDILDYRLFAVAVKENSHLDLWIDPVMYKKSMEKMIKSDFNCDEDITLNYVNSSDGNDFVGQIEYDYSDMLSFEHVGLQYSARFYIAPKRKMFAYHNEIIQT